MPKVVVAWEDMDHADTPLISYEVLRNLTHTKRPLPEFLAKKRAEQAEKTAVWYEEALGQ
jgi:hypothetical protein